MRSGRNPASLFIHPKTLYTMHITLHIKTVESNKEFVVKFDKVHNLHCYNTTVDFDVEPDYTQSENANDYNASTAPYHKKFYDVVDCHVEA